MTTTEIVFVFGLIAGLPGLIAGWLLVDVWRLRRRVSALERQR